jgi:hypothetical protein
MELGESLSCSLLCYVLSSNNNNKSSYKALNSFYISYKHAHNFAFTSINKEEIWKLRCGTSSRKSFVSTFAAHVFRFFSGRWHLIYIHEQHTEYWFNVAKPVLNFNIYSFTWTWNGTHNAIHLTLYRLSARDLWFVMTWKVNQSITLKCNLFSSDDPSLSSY